MNAWAELLPIVFGLVFWGVVPVVRDFLKSPVAAAVGVACGPTHAWWWAPHLCPVCYPPAERDLLLPEPRKKMPPQVPEQDVRVAAHFYAYDPNCRMECCS